VRVIELRLVVNETDFETAKEFRDYKADWNGQPDLSFIKKKKGNAQIITNTYLTIK